ncbi:hypothetical protein AGOR_G00067080 [Albula goreensis]|uniref:Cyclin-D1-binding protein 1 homolog n=1 Tax=Albula goreensis TaxID=1534307 RepID=A0A8T3DZ39_9TELE|nr:hypothetical protein AGOR_G00067080 [Albula goreensis]
MSADNSCPDVSVPLRNLLNSVQCIRDRVKDGESNESSGGFNLQNFWDTLNQAVKAVSRGHKAEPCLFKTSSAFTTGWRKTHRIHSEDQGITLRKVVRDATAEVLDGIVQLIDIILSSPLQSLSQEQLTSTGGVWSACDQFAHLPKDNKAAVLESMVSCVRVVKDAIEEMEQAQADSHDPFGDVLDDEDLDSRGNQDTYWSESDRQLMAPCQGLMKASAACLRKLSAAVRANGKVDTPENIAQLDDLADITKEISPSVDDLALSLYPPMDYSGVENNASKLASVLKKVLEITRASHVCLEGDLNWVQFLDGAVEHNLQKVKALAQGSS